MDSKIQGSKLSATVPAFVPGKTYTGVTSGGLSSELVIKSTLSPFVPEFRPSGSFAPLLSAPYQPTCSLLQHNSKQAYLKYQKVDLKENVSHGAHQTSFQATANKSTTKVKKPDSAEKIRESQNVSGSNSSEHLTENCANVSKKKRQKKRKQSNSLIDYQGNEEKTEGSTEKALHQEKDVSPQKVIDDIVCSKENGVTNSQPNCKSLPSSSKSTSSSEVNTKDEKANMSSANHDSHNNKTQYPAPHLTVSYSDKVKSSSLNINSSASKRALGDKSLIKNFTVENSNKIVDAVDLGHSSKINVDKDKSTSNVGSKKRMASNSGRLSNAPIKPLDSTSGEDGEHYQQKYCNSSNSETSNLKQIPRTGKFMGRNNSFKKKACDDDDNWRVKKEFLPVADSSSSQKIDSVKKVNTENPNIQSCKKITSHQKGEKRVTDSKKYNSDDSRKKSMDVMDKVPKTSSNHRTFSDNNGSSLTEPSTKCPVTKLDSEVPIISSQEPKINQLPAASVNTASSNIGAMKGEFPDLMESTKIKRVPVTDGLTVGFKETVTPSKPPATLSYSAALRSIPKPKSVMVPTAWENEKPTTRGGLLKVPSHSGADQPESEPAGQENSPTKKKKKKKKKTAESGGQSQEGGSAKRTQKPIQFDLGVMLQNISKNSPEKTQQSGRKVVVATGVLPTQLSAAASSYEEKPAVISPLRKSENKIPHNKLDSTAPVIKRGKERETPAKKKPSALKKIILKEREEKKKARKTSESGDVETSNDSTNRACESEGENIVHQAVQDQSEAETAEEVEPSSPTDQEIAAEIHSRRFREYCCQVPDKEVDAVASELLRELVRFQDRQFHKDPIKAKAKRRFVLGLREVHKHLKLRKVKCVIISSNVERIKSAGGLDDTVGSIIRLCEENHIPVVFALKRQLLGRVLLKKVPVSIVGIFNYDGAQEHFKTLMDLTQKTKQAYDEKWQEAKEKLELQQQKTLDAKRPEMEVLSSSEVQEADDISQTLDKDLGKENDQVHDTESSDNEERESDEENSHVHSEEENIIVENDLKIQEL